MYVKVSNDVKKSEVINFIVVTNCCVHGRVFSMLKCDFENTFKKANPTKRDYNAIHSKKDIYVSIDHTFQEKLEWWYVYISEINYLYENVYSSKEISDLHCCQLDALNELMGEYQKKFNCSYVDVIKAKDLFNDILNSERGII